MSTTVKRSFNGRRAVLAATAAAAAAAGALSAQGAFADEQDEVEARACEIETLPIPDGLEFTFVTGMSDDGSVIAYRAYPTDGGYERFPLLYSDGEVTEVPIPGEDQQIADVNSSGLGAGFTFIGDQQVPYVWRDGEVAELPSTDGGEANGVNENGDIVGARGQADSVPVIWPAGADEPVDLPLPDNAAWGTATAVGEDGTVVGYYGDAETGDFKPYVWNAEGTGSDLPMPEGVDPAEAHAYVSHLAGDWASGYLSAPGHDAVGIRWNIAEGTAEVLRIEGPAAVNAEGTTASSVFPNAAVQSGDEVVELPGVSDPADNYFGDNADQISADGSLVAGNVYVGEGEHSHILNAVVWTCG